MLYQRILEAVYNQPLAILPEKLEQVQAFLALKARGVDVPPEQVHAIVAERDNRRALAIPDALITVRRPDGVLMAGRVAIVSVFGVLAQRAGPLDQMSGIIGTERLGATLDSLIVDRQVKSIIMAFDSPGGSVFGIPELAKKIRDARAEKKIAGIADSLAASAGYWLLAQTSEITVTPAGQVGSVGVIAAHVDVSKMEEILGVKTTLVTSSPFKAEFAPEQPLSEEARAELQGKVNAYHAMFTADLAKGRGVSQSRVEKDFGGGRMFLAEEAVKRGLADRVGTLAQLLDRLGANETGGPKAEARPLGAKLAAYRARAVQVEE